MKKIVGELVVDRFVVPYRIYGEGRDTILCLSGAKQTMSAWRSFVSYFQRDFRVVVFDMPGQGRAQVTSGSNRVTLDEQIQVVHELVQEVGLFHDAESFMLVVHGDLSWQLHMLPDILMCLLAWRLVVLGRSQM